MYCKQELSSSLPISDQVQFKIVPVNVSQYGFEFGNVPIGRNEASGEYRCLWRSEEPEQESACQIRVVDEERFIDTARQPTNIVESCKSQRTGLHFGRAFGSSLNR